MKKASLILGAAAIVVAVGLSLVYSGSFSTASVTDTGKPLLGLGQCVCHPLAADCNPGCGQQKGKASCQDYDSSCLWAAGSGNSGCASTAIKTCKDTGKSGCDLGRCVREKLESECNSKMPELDKECPDTGPNTGSCYCDPNVACAVDCPSFSSENTCLSHSADHCLWASSGGGGPCVKDGLLSQAATCADATANCCNQPALPECACTETICQVTCGDTSL